MKAKITYLEMLARPRSCRRPGQGFVVVKNPPFGACDASPAVVRSTLGDCGTQTKVSCP